VDVGWQQVRIVQVPTRTNLVSLSSVALSGGPATWAEGATPVGPLASDSVTDPVTPFLITQLGDRIFYKQQIFKGGGLFRFRFRSLVG